MLNGILLSAICAALKDSSAIEVRVRVLAAGVSNSMESIDLANLRRWKPYLDDLKRKRIGASKKRWTVRDRIGTVREAYARTAETLKSVLSDFIVSLKFSRSAYSPDAEKQIIQAMGWRTIQVSRAGLLIERLTVPGLLEAIDKRDTTAIMSVLTSEGARIFDKGEADRIIEQLSVPAIRFALERCEVHDLPRLSVTKAIAGPGGTKAILYPRVFKALTRTAAMGRSPPKSSLQNPPPFAGKTIRRCCRWRAALSRASP